MKMLIVQNGWSGQGISGGDKHLIDVGTHWQKNLEVSYLMPKSGSEFLKINFANEIEGFNLIIIPEITRFKRLNNLVLLLIAYFQRLLSGAILAFFLPKYDIVLASSHFFYDTVIALILKLRKKSKFIVYVYHLVSDQDRKNSLRDWVSKVMEGISLTIIKSNADVIFTDNQSTLNNLIDRGVGRPKIFLTAVGIKKPLMFSLPKKFDLCFTGRLIRRKGVYDLIKIVSELKFTLPKIQLSIVGLGDELENLKKEVSRLDLSDNIKFLGFLKETDKFRVLSQSKIFVLPSLEEGWGISLAEALAYELPAVVYDLPVLREIFVNGPVYVYPSDTKICAKEILKLLVNEDYYSQKSRDAVESVKNYYLEDVAQREYRVISGLIK